MYINKGFIYCGDVPAACTSTRASAPHSAALVVLNGQHLSPAPSLQCHFSTINIVEQQRTHGQRAGHADCMVGAHSELILHEPPGEYKSMQVSMFSFKALTDSLPLVCTSRQPQGRLPTHCAQSLPWMPPARSSQQVPASRPTPWPDHRLAAPTGDQPSAEPVGDEKLLLTGAIGPPAGGTNCHHLSPQPQMV